jgi:hypothetical protein
MVMSPCACKRETRLLLLRGMVWGGWEWFLVGVPTCGEDSTLGVGKNRSDGDS